MGYIAIAVGVDAGAGVTDVAPVGEQAEKTINPSVSMEDMFFMGSLGILPILIRKMAFHVSRSFRKYTKQTTEYIQGKILLQRKLP